MTHTIIVIPANGRDAANAWMCAHIAADAGETFTVGLSADGAVPASHYWCGIALTDAQMAAVTEHFAGQVYPGGDPATVLAAAGLQVMAVTDAGYAAQAVARAECDADAPVDIISAP